jgi:hypothetical protein
MSYKQLTSAFVCGFPYVVSKNTEYDIACVEVLFSNGTKTIIEDALDEDDDSIVLNLKRGQRVNLISVVGKWMIHSASTVIYNNRATATAIDSLFQIKLVLSTVKISDHGANAVLKMLSEKIENSMFEIERIEAQTKGSRSGDSKIMQSLKEWEQFDDMLAKRKQA